MTEFTRPITMKDIAREAGVSISAVSHALRGHSKISEETRERADRGLRV